MINQLKTVLLLGCLTAVMLGVGNLLGGMSGLTIAIIIAVLINFVTYFFSDKIVLRMYSAKEAKEKDYPELYKIVREVSHLADIPMPKVYVIPKDTPNAFATGRNPKNAAVACTTGIMELLSTTELKGVIAHEMAHIKNRDILIATIAATIAGIISYAAMMARFAAIFGGFGGRDGEGGQNIVSLLVLAILAPLIAVIIQLAISRSREYHADEIGAKMIHNPHALAEALHKLDVGIKQHPMKGGNPTTASLFIMNPFNASGFTKWFSTHPPLKERIKRLKNMHG